MQDLSKKMLAVGLLKQMPSLRLRLVHYHVRVINVNLSTCNLGNHSCAKIFSE